MNNKDFLEEQASLASYKLTTEHRGIKKESPEAIGSPRELAAKVGKLPLRGTHTIETFMGGVFNSRTTYKIKQFAQWPNLSHGWAIKKSESVWDSAREGSCPVCDNSKNKAPGFDKRAFGKCIKSLYFCKECNEGYFYQ